MFDGNEDFAKDFYNISTAILMTAVPTSDVNLSNILNVERCVFELMMKETQTDVRPKDKGKRGRKLLRPNDPLIVKSEIKDKFWLRQFRTYMRNHFHKFKASFTDSDKKFWIEHLSTQGKPDKGSKFLSFNKEYKLYLLRHPSYFFHFRQWFFEQGTKYLAKKCEPGSDMWQVYYNYVVEVLLPLHDRSI